MNNFNVNALSSEARTVDVNVDLTNSQHTGIHVIIDMTAVTATGSVTATIQGYDAASDKYYTLLQAVAITGVSTVILRVHPDLAPSANLIADDFVPSKFRIEMNHLNTVAMTYSVGVNYV